MSPRTGRPKIDNPKNQCARIRFDEQEYAKLMDYCKRHNILRTEAIREGIRLLLESEK